MPEENNSPSAVEPKKIVDLNNNPPLVQFNKRKFTIGVVVAVIIFLVGQVIAFKLGENMAKNGSDETTVSKTSVATSSSQPIQNLKTGGLEDKIEVSSGVSIQLTSASIDQQYEQEKLSQKAYYEKNASQSAYLNSDYFHQSSLVLKISITNNNKTVITYNPASFRLKDSQDNQYVSGYSGEGGQPSIYNLNANETTKLTNIYLVPDSETHFKLIYENAVIQFTISR